MSALREDLDLRPEEFPDDWTPPATVAADPFHNHADNSPF